MQADENIEWKVLKPDVFAAIMDFFTSGLPVVNEDAKPSEDTGEIEPLWLTICIMDPSFEGLVQDDFFFSEQHRQKTTTK